MKWKVCIRDPYGSCPMQTNEVPIRAKIDSFSNRRQEVSVLSAWYIYWELTVSLTPRTCDREFDQMLFGSNTQQCSIFNELSLHFLKLAIWALRAQSAREAQIASLGSDKHIRRYNISPYQFIRSSYFDDIHEEVLSIFREQNLIKIGSLMIQLINWLKLRICSNSRGLPWFI